VHDKPKLKPESDVNQK
jgi:hypothetical protein